MQISGGLLGDEHTVRGAKPRTQLGGKEAAVLRAYADHLAATCGLGGAAFSIREAGNIRIAHLLKGRVLSSLANGIDNGSGIRAGH